MNLSRVCFNTSTFVPNDLAQCLSCVLFATQCAFGVRLGVGALEQPTMRRIVWRSYAFPLSRRRKKGVFDKTLSLNPARAESPGYRFPRGSLQQFVDENTSGNGKHSSY